jgi:hypothetical protein
MFAGLSWLAAAASATAGCWREGEGWPHAPLPVARMDDNGNGDCNCLREKGVGQGGGRGEIERWACFFMLSYFVIVFLSYPFQCRLTDFVSSSSQLLDRLLLQDFSSSCPNLVITFLFGNYSVRVNCGE